MAWQSVENLRPKQQPLFDGIEYSVGVEGNAF